jgi:fused signal recognition particle receptor
MFGLLKKKFKDLSHKIFGKSQEKIEDEESKSVEDEESKSVDGEESKSVDGEESKSVEDESSDILKDKDLSTIKNSDKSLNIEKASDVKSISDSDLKDISKEGVIGSSDFISKEVIEEPPYLKKDVSSEDISQNDLNVGQKISDSDSNDLNVGQKPSDPDQEIDLEKNKLNELSYRLEKIPLKEDLSKTPPSLEKNLPEKSLDSLKEDLDVKKEPSQPYKDLESKKIEDVKKTTFTKIKGLFSSKIKLSENEISSFLEDFEISLLEADVSIDSASSIIEDLKKRLVDFSFSKSNLLEDIKSKIRETLENQLNIDCDINNYISKDYEKPLIILFIGPNGAGKTTTISKFANLYKERGDSVVLASSDTFRAGSIDQLEIHAKRIGVKVVKQNYGSDPAAVAFDAVSSAKANKNNVVLIDTAGRQDTNINLMQELFKIKRVVKPHLTIYIGESQSGQAIVEQIEKFDKEIGITGVILTKIDTDPKGGVAISILNELKKPIFYIGTGQEYKDLEKFSPRYIIDRIV